MVMDSPEIRAFSKGMVKSTQKTSGNFLRCTAGKDDRLVCYLFSQSVKPEFPVVGYASRKLEIVKPLECQLFPGKKVRCT